MGTVGTLLNRARVESIAHGFLFFFFDHQQYFLK
jgi:hypothetical protein